MLNFEKLTTAFIKRIFYIIVFEVCVDSLEIFKKNLITKTLQYGGKSNETA